MARKVFISVLGTSFYKPCIYGDTGIKTRFIQEATLLSIGTKEWGRDDTGIVLLTDFARKTNWEVADNQRLDKTIGTVEDYCGLRQRIDALQLPFAVRDIPIPDGKNEDEMWTIFTTLFNELQEGDELYIDLTHAFRYLPMLVLVLTNYAKFLKGVTVKSITYGNWEARDGDRAPIVDLLPIAALQDWTHAAASFIQDGDAAKLAQMTLSELKPILRDRTRDDLKSAQMLRVLVDNLEKVTSEMLTCRGLSIENSETIKALKKYLNQLEEVIIKPIKPIIDKVKDEFTDFNEEPDVKNGFHAAKWCIQHGLYQQATTILQESVVSFFCRRYEGIVTCDQLEDSRNIISTAFNILAEGIAEENWRLRKQEYLPRLKKVLNAFEDDYDAFVVQTQGDQKEHISATYRALSDLRNDINHNGMRNNPLKPLAIKRKTEEFYNRIYSCLFE